MEKRHTKTMIVVQANGQTENEYSVVLDKHLEYIRENFPTCTDPFCFQTAAMDGRLTTLIQWNYNEEKTADNIMIQGMAKAAIISWKKRCEVTDSEEITNKNLELAIIEEMDKFINN